MTDKNNKEEHFSEESQHTGEALGTESSDQSQSSNKVEDAEEKLKGNRKSRKDKSADKTEELKKSLEEMADRHLRLQAEFDNFRKRTLKEKADLIKSGGESVLTNILPIIDDFDRALGSMTGVPEEDPAKIGFMLIFSKFKDFLKNNNVVEIAATGQDFDVDLHEAITKIPAPAPELKGKVVDVVQKGYQLNGKVIRYAKVVIGD
jgi:molecular chaperone GrpE